MLSWFEFLQEGTKQQPLILASLLAAHFGMLQLLLLESQPWSRAPRESSSASVGLWVSIFEESDCADNYFGHPSLIYLAGTTTYFATPIADTSLFLVERFQGLRPAIWPANQLQCLFPLWPSVNRNAIRLHGMSRGSYGAFYEFCSIVFPCWWDILPPPL